MFLNDPAYRVAIELNSAVYGVNTDYGFIDPVGNRKNVESITKEDIEEWKANYFIPENMFIIFPEILLKNM